MWSVSTAPSFCRLNGEPQPVKMKHVFRWKGQVPDQAAVVTIGNPSMKGRGPCIFSGRYRAKSSGFRLCTPDFCCVSWFESILRCELRPTGAWRRVNRWCFAACLIGYGALLLLLLFGGD